MLRTGGMLLMALLLIAATLLLAFANGANDVSKGIATLVGSGLSHYRPAVLWGSLCTVAGGLAAAFASQALVATFSGNGILLESGSNSRILLAVAAGAIGWLLIATSTGLPVSTTHSIAGALIGAAIVSGGTSGVAWGAVAAKVALPLLASPLLSLLIVVALLPMVRPLLGRVDRYCVCLEQRELVAITSAGTSYRERLSSIETRSAESCATPVARFTAVDLLHWLSSGATSFFRGMNDTPKILALGIGAAAAGGVAAGHAYMLVALAMGAGSVIAGFRVTHTLARKVTPITPSNGFAANVVTSVLVALASRFALPVSTTHVSSGAIIGIGVSAGDNALRWRTVARMLAAWVVTLPVSALLAALFVILL
ncbi:MAG TPA: inorganic phosphate transporter [Thermoanaerobaculia bacterium]|nr:inorganic phosphate transporter [Thermoanaerobaculia bacterium]